MGHFMGVNLILGQALCKHNVFMHFGVKYFMEQSISKHQKSRERWFHYYSLTNSQHLNDDIHDKQTMCKPKKCSKRFQSGRTKISHVQTSILFMQTPKSQWFWRFLQIPEPTWHILIAWPDFLVHQLKSRFGENFVIPLFTLIYTCLHPFAPLFFILILDFNGLLF